MTNGSEIIKNETMTSLEMAEVTGRNHKDVMRSIREMEDAWVKVNGRKFALVEYKDAKGEMKTAYGFRWMYLEDYQKEVNKLLEEKHLTI